MLKNTYIMDMYTNIRPKTAPDPPESPNSKQIVKKEKSNELKKKSIK